MTPIRRGRALADVPLGAPAIAQEPPALADAEIPSSSRRPRAAVVAVSAPRLGLAPDGDVMGELLRRFREGGGPRLPGLPFPDAEAAHAAGSGFVIDPQGLIVTADALVEVAERIEVTPASVKARRAEVAGRDPRRGLALLRVGVDGPLPTLAWGGADGLAPGSALVTLGRAEGFGAILSAAGARLGPTTARGCRSATSPPRR